MAQSCFRHARISGISAVVPKGEVRLADELQYFGGDEKKAARMTTMVGIDRRRVADEGVTPADLCQDAAERLIQGMNLDRNSIDAVFMVTQHPDYALPATACLLQDKLKLPKTCAAFDVNQGCAAYTYGLWLASSLLEARAASRILLLVGDGMGRLRDQANRVLAPVFGDCGSATLLEYTEDSPSWFELGTDGSGAEAIIRPALCSRIPYPPTPEEYAPLVEAVTDPNGNPWHLTDTFMDGGAVFDFTINVVPDHILSLLNYANLRQEDIDRLLLHQANRQIMKAVAQKTGFPLEKTPMQTFSRYGNCAAASLPSVICEELAQDLQNNRLRVLLSGYGVGLSWASAVLDLDRVWCPGMGEYETPPHHPKPKDLIRYWQKKIRG